MHAWERKLGSGVRGWGLEVACFCRDTNVRFSAELRRLQSLPKCERLPLPSFLLLPFQRITRLRMLLQVPGEGGRGEGWGKGRREGARGRGPLLLCPSAPALAPLGNSPRASQSRTHQAFPGGKQMSTGAIWVQLKSAPG